MLFRHLWLRPELNLRDRSLVTISALIATGSVAQLGGHLERAMDNGLTQAETSAALEHLAFYAGWPNVFTAMPITKEALEKRKRQCGRRDASGSIAALVGLDLSFAVGVRVPEPSACIGLRRTTR